MTAITRPDPGLVPQRGTRDEAQLIKDQLAPKATNAEIRVFLALCQRLDLDPWARQIYLVGRWDSRARAEVFTPQVSIDGFRLVAQRTNEYAGQTSPEWCAADGVWRDVWLSHEPPVAARVGVYRKGWAAPLYRVALWEEFKQTHKDKSSGQQVLSPMWARMPSVMLAKCAEMQALRAAFPNELSGVYGVEEMAQATPVTVEPEREPPADDEAADALAADFDAAWEARDKEEHSRLRGEAQALWPRLTNEQRARLTPLLSWRTRPEAQSKTNDDERGDGYAEWGGDDAA